MREIAKQITFGTTIGYNWGLGRLFWSKPWQGKTRSSVSVTRTGKGQCILVVTPPKQRLDSNHFELFNFNNENLIENLNLNDSSATSEDLLANISVISGNRIGIASDSKIFYVDETQFLQANVLEKVREYFSKPIIFVTSGGSNSSEVLAKLSNEDVLVVTADEKLGAQQSIQRPHAADKFKYAVIFVGVQERSGQVLRTSNEEIFAPGREIVVASLGSTRYRIASHRDISAAFVAGIAACVLEEYPNASGSELKEFLLSKGCDQDSQGNRRLFFPFQIFEPAWFDFQNFIGSFKAGDKVDFQFQTVSPYEVHYTISDGRLPVGLALQRDGRLLGVIGDSKADFQFTVQAENSEGVSQQVYWLKVGSLASDADLTTPYFSRL